MLRDWLPPSGTVLEVASGTGEHACYFAERFPALVWQPSDADPGALLSVSSWRASTELVNLAEPVALDAGGAWPQVHADAILCINMAHISPWAATLGLLENAARLLTKGEPLIFYGPWIVPGLPTTQSNLEFDSSLRARDSLWGLRSVEALAAAAKDFGFSLTERRAMPANNLMLLLTRI